MVNWKYKINIADIVKDYDSDEENIGFMGKAVAQRIQDSLVYKEQLFLRTDLDEIIELFEDSCSECEFDYALNELYDLCDDELIWVETNIV